MGDALGREKSAALWQWKHQTNPAGPSLGYAAYTPGGELIALRPFMRWRLLDDAGAEIAAVRAVDTAVHPEWRRSGLFSRLTQLSLEELDSEGVGLVFNTPNDRSGPGYQKMGWRLLGNPTVWIRPRLGFGLFGSSDLPHSGIERLRTYSKKGRTLALSSAQTAPSGTMAIFKNAAFLDWRYGQHPNLTYSLVESEEGAAILRDDRRAGLAGVALVDWFLKSESISAFRALLGAVRAQTRGAYLITGPLPAGSLRRAAISRSFLPFPWRNVNLAARPVGLSPEASVFHSRTAWRLTLGDLETF